MGHPIAGPDPAAVQVLGDPVRAPVKRFVGLGSAVADQRRAVGMHGGVVTQQLRESESAITSQWPPPKPPAWATTQATRKRGRRPRTHDAVLAQLYVGTIYGRLVSRS